MAVKDRMPTSEFQSKYDLSEHSSTAEVNDTEDEDDIDCSSDEKSSVSSDSSTSNSDDFTISNESNESNDIKDDCSIVSQDDDCSVVELLEEEQEELEDTPTVSTLTQEDEDSQVRSSQRDFKLIERLKPK